MKQRMAQPPPHIREDLLDQYAMATLPEQSAAEVEEHLLSCSLCQKRLVETDEFLTVFRAAATQLDARPARRRWRLPSRIIAGAVAATAALLVFLISGERQNAEPSAMLLMQSFRGPEAAAHMVSGRPYRLAFDLSVQATVDYEVEIVDEIGNGILRVGAEVRNGQLTVPLGKLARGSYWVRVYRTQPDRQVVAEYGLRAD
jgi:hypothetical protein